MKKILCVMLVIIIALCYSFSSSAYVTGGSSDFRYADHTGAYRVECSSKRAVINRFASVNRYAVLDLQSAINGVCGFGGRFVFLSNDIANNQLIVYVYSLDSDSLDSFCIYGVRLYGDTDYCCDGDYLYIENNSNSYELKKYSLTGSYIRSFTFSRDITSAFCGYGSGIYVTGGDTLYRISGNSFTSLSGASVGSDLFAASDNYLVSGTGAVYRVSGGTEKLFDAGSDISGACVIGDRIYCSSGNSVNGYDLSSGEKVCTYSCGFAPVLLYADGNSVISASSGNNSLSISRDSFTDLRKNDAESGSSNQSSGSSGSVKGVISSDVYKVSSSDYRISGISSGTTVAGFRSNMKYSGYTLSVFRDGTEKKSGEVGTAMTAVFTSGNASYTYELSVIGDVTGEGNVNSRDLRLLMDYLIGAADYNGVYILSSDLSGDGKVDVIDLAMMKRITE